MSRCPKISIITVSLNAVKTIEQTIRSVINQSYKNIEYIIIDGGSTDGTVDIIKKYEDRIDHWLSKSDAGIYDAMNKGTQLATGDWVNYMNAGDRFYCNTVLEDLFKQRLDEETSVVYGNSENILNYYSYLEEAKPLSHLWKGMCFPHQSMFVTANIAKEIPYNTKFKFGADFNFIYTLYKIQKVFLYKPICIVNFRRGGVSDVKRFQSLLEWRKTVRQHDGFDIKKELYYLLKIFDILVRQSVKKIIPRKLVEKIILLKNAYRNQYDL